MKITDARHQKSIFAVTAISLLILFFIMMVRFDLTYEYIIGYGLLFFMLFMSRTKLIPPYYTRIIVIILGSMIAFRYWYFRTTETIFYTGFLDFISVMLLYGAETYGVIIHLLGGFINIMPFKRSVNTLSPNNPNLPTVDVFIPTYSEPFDITMATAVASLSMIYPKEKLNVYILDDGGTINKRHAQHKQNSDKAQIRFKSFKTIVEFMKPDFPNLHYLTRTDNSHAKAGNVNHALFFRKNDFNNTDINELSSFHTITDMPEPGQLVLILDCDHIPTEDFLLNTVGYFIRNKNLFLVQTPHFFINPDPIEKNLQTFKSLPSENEMFYGAIQHGLDSWGGSFFCGSAALMNRKHLEDNNGLSGDTITEDAESALNMHSKGLDSIYLGRPMVCGLSPETFTDFILQRNRWAQGMSQIFILKKPMFLKGLTIPQRLCYINSCFFWFFGIARLIFIISPLLYIFFGLHVYDVSLGQLFAFTVPHIIGAVMMSNFLYGNVRPVFFSELYETVQSIFNLPAVLGVLLNPKSPTFKVTPKDRSLSKDFLSPLAYPFYILITIFILSFPVALWRWHNAPFDRGIIIITMLWSLFHILMLFLCLGIVWEKKQVRKRHRIAIEETVTLESEDKGICYKAQTTDISDAGIGMNVYKASSEIKNGDVLIMKSNDGQYTFKIKVLNTLDRGDYYQVGSIYIIEDEFSWINLIRFTYGKSSRWVNFWGNRRQHMLPFWSQLFGLFSLSLYGLKQNFSGVYAATKYLFTGVITNIKNKYKIWRSSYDNF